MIGAVVPLKTNSPLASCRWFCLREAFWLLRPYVSCGDSTLSPLFSTGTTAKPLSLQPASGASGGHLAQKHLRVRQPLFPHSPTTMKVALFNPRATADLVVGRGDGASLLGH